LLGLLQSGSFDGDRRIGLVLEDSKPQSLFFLFVSIRLLLVELFLDLGNDFIETFTLLLLDFAAYFHPRRLFFAIALLTLHENYRFVGFRVGKVLLFPIDQLELFFGKARGTVILLLLIEVATIRICIVFLHGKYMI
jgi:hypothetical protein